VFDAAGAPEMLKPKSPDVRFSSPDARLSSPDVSSWYSPDSSRDGPGDWLLKSSPGTSAMGAVAGADAVVGAVVGTVVGAVVGVVAGAERSGATAVLKV
jgi:hypothetical protein